MSLNFLLQFEQYQSARHEQDSMIQIKDSKVMCGNIPVANLNNVPFVGKNPDYLRLRESLQKIQEEIVSFESIIAATPNKDLEGMLLQKRSDREKLTKELEELEKSLMDTAKQIVSLSYTASSVRLQKAIELFEKGDWWRRKRMRICPKSLVMSAIGLVSIVTCICMSRPSRNTRKR